MPPTPIAPDDPPWDPWAEVVRRPDVLVALDPVAGLLGGGFVLRRRGRAVIVVDPTLDVRRQRAVLAHELVHLERGTADRHGAPATWDAVVDREERLVDREVARRLAPPARVRAALAELGAAQEPATAEAVAERLDVDPGVAEVALELLGLAPPR